MLLFGKPVDDMNAVADADTDQQRERDDIGRVERHMKDRHEAEHPADADHDRHQNQQHAGRIAKVQHQHHQDATKCGGV